jgi:putative membrane protein
MQAKKKPVAVHENRLATEFLANERTFLAWVRTSIAVITLGFVVARFGVWLRELATQFAPRVPMPRTEISLYAGVAMMVLGGVITLLAAWRYHVVNLAIEHGQVTADRGLIFLVAATVSVLSVALTVYLVIGAG